MKEAAFRPDLLSTLNIWDMQLVQYGCKVIAARRKFVEKLNHIIQDIHFQLTGEKESIELIYEPNILEERFEETLERQRDRDLKLKSTGYGSSPGRYLFSGKWNRYSQIRFPGSAEDGSSFPEAFGD